MTIAAAGLVVTGLLAFLFFVLLYRQGANLSHWGSALAKVLITWLLSNCPLLFLTLESALNPTKSMAELFFSNVRFGEAIIYVAAILAPVLYTVGWHWKPAAKLYLFTNLVGVLACISIGAYVYARHLGSLPVDGDALFGITVALYILSMLFWYFSLVYELIVSSPSPGRDSARRVEEIERSLP